MTYEVEKVFEDLIREISNTRIKKMNTKRNSVRADQPTIRKLTSLEVFKLSDKIKEVLTEQDLSGPNDILRGFEYRHRNYDEKSIKAILKEKKEYCLTTNEISTKFKVSRNTVAKWLLNHHELNR